ncbi:hypothetical protein JCM18237_09470 [Halorubrum luteum]
MDPDRLDTALAEAFGGTEAERRAVVRAARDLVDAEKPASDRGHALTVDDVVRNLSDAPDGSSVADRWNWWMGALEAAYGGYDYFTIRFTANDEEAGLRR